MKRCHMMFAPALASVMLIGAGSAGAEIDRSPTPGGVYKLKPGIFVDATISCTNPPNAAIKLYDGKGISTAHTRACIARIISKRKSGRGSLYKVSQSCIDAGSGPGKRFTELQTVKVTDALNFAITSKGGARYRYYPASDLPDGLRNVLPSSSLNR